jgi:hypothetical protein
MGRWGLGTREGGVWGVWGDGELGAPTTDREWGLGAVGRWGLGVPTLWDWGVMGSVRSVKRINTYAQ